MSCPEKKHQDISYGDGVGVSEELWIQLCLGCRVLVILILITPVGDYNRSTSLELCLK